MLFLEGMPANAIEKIELLHNLALNFLQLLVVPF
jgi:hypothetical protein